MLRMRTLVPSLRFTIWRVASMPFSSGSETSMTATCGRTRSAISAAARLGHHLDAVVRFQDAAQRLADHGVIVDQQDPELHWCEGPPDGAPLSRTIWTVACLILRMRRAAGGPSGPSEAPLALLMRA